MRVLKQDSKTEGIANLKLQLRWYDWLNMPIKLLKEMWNLPRSQRVFRLSLEKAKQLFTPEISRFKHTLVDCLKKVLVSLPTPRRKFSLRPLKICAQLGRDPVRPNSKNLTTEVRVPKVQMSLNSTQD